MNVLELNSILDDTAKVFKGKYSGFQRFDKPTFTKAVKLEELMRGQYWNPNEISIQGDTAFVNEREDIQAIMQTVWFYQTLMDSAQNRGLGYTLSDLVTCPEYDALVRTWEYFELIHSLSYSHIIRGIYNTPAIFDKLCTNDAIKKRVETEIRTYTTILQTQTPTNEDLLKLVCTIFALEGIKFYVSFLMTYLVQDTTGAIPGATRIIKLINNDEDLHTQASIVLLQDSKLLELVNPVHVEQIVDDVIGNVKYNEIEFAKILYNICSEMPETYDNIVKFIEFYCDKRKNEFLTATMHDVTTDNKLVNWFEREKQLNNSNVAIQESDLLVYNIGMVVDDL